MKEDIGLTSCKHFPTTNEFHLLIVITEGTVDYFLLKPGRMLRKSYSF